MSDAIQQPLNTPRRFGLRQAAVVLGWGGVVAAYLYFVQRAALRYLEYTTVWVFARDAPGPLRIVGRQLNGPGVATFRWQSSRSKRKDAMVLSDPALPSAIPGGASDANGPDTDIP